MTDEIVATSSSEVTRGAQVSGTVSRLALGGVVLQMGEKEGFLHISQLGKPVRNVEEAELKVGDVVEAYVLKHDKEGHMALTMMRPPAVAIDGIRVGDIFQGKVARIERYGAFVDIGADRLGMVHVSEMADGYIQSPDDVVRVGDIIEVRVIKLDKKKKQIDLSMKSDIEETRAAIAEVEDNLPTAMELALRRAQAANRRANDRRANDRRQRIQSDRDDVFERTLRNNYKK